METPNIYRFATSELSQDATLAYILSWANPEYRTEHPALNTLGERLLRALVTCAADALGESDPLAGKPVEKLEVGTQAEHIDVWVKMNGVAFLIIEDKTRTFQHSNQIERYGKLVADKKTESGGNWQQLPVYVKTGNECAWQPDSASPHGIFLRPQLLEVLGSVPHTDNTIIEEFRQHLQAWQNETESFAAKPCEQWSWHAKEGYYMALEGWLRNRFGNESYVGWRYVANANEGFLGFWWYWASVASQRCHLYLQIEDATRLHIRVCSAKDEEGNSIKAPAGMMWAVFNAIEDAARRDEFKELRIEKSGRFKGGSTAAVADVSFDKDKGSYLAVDARGLLDFDTTKRHLLLATRLVDAVSGN